jgi:hypothetical protein
MIAPLPVVVTRIAAVSYASIGYPQGLRKNSMGGPPAVALDFECQDILPGLPVGAESHTATTCDILPARVIPAATSAITQGLG